MEAARLAHVGHAGGCVAWWHADHVCGLDLIVAFVKTLSANVSGYVILSLMHLIILIRKIIILHHGWRRHHHIRRTILRHLLYFDLLRIVRLPCKHQLSTHLVTLIARPLMIIRFTIFFHFFHAVSVPQSVQGMFCARIRGAHICDHGCSTVSGEGVS